MWDYIFNTVEPVFIARASPSHNMLSHSYIKLSGRGGWNKVGAFPK